MTESLLGMQSMNQDFVNVSYGDSIRVFNLILMKMPIIVQ